MRLLLANSVALVLLMAAQTAWADLSLFPTRLVLEKNQRAAQVELMNSGTEPETYRIRLVNRRMGENGEFIAIEAPGPGEQFADPLLRYSPRQVTIAPGTSQTVRLLLRKPADLAAGEYRSHLQFDRVLDATGASSVESVRSTDNKEIGVVIRALVGASIPVIVRQGDTQATATLSNLVLEQPAASQPSMLVFQMLREGNRSVYGDLAVRWTPRGGKPVDVAKAGGVAVYVPNTMRRARLPLQLPPEMALTGGRLDLTFRERPEAGGKLLAEAGLDLP